LVEEALALFQEWKTKVTCNTILYSTLIKGFASAGDPDRAMALYQDMRSNGVCMNSIAFTSLIDAHARNGLMTRAEALLAEMRADGCDPNRVTYSSLIRGHCVRGDLSGALGCFQRMLDVGILADEVTFNTLLHGCVRANSFELADEVWEKMRAQRVEPSDYTWSILIKMWSRRGNLDRAFEALREALGRAGPGAGAGAGAGAGGRPCGRRAPRVDAQLGACIVGACIHNHSPDRALAVFEEMKSWPNFAGPDVHTYSAIITGLARARRTHEATQIAFEFCSQFHRQPSYDRQELPAGALAQLFRALRAQRHPHALSARLAAELRGAGHPVDKRWVAA